MATQTQTLRRPVVQAERVHDYLYDNHYVVSSERDHARATFKAHTSTDRVKRVPNYPTMFSELHHFPRYQMRLDVTDPVPKFISRQWRGYADQHREALVRYTTFNYDPSVKLPAKNFDGAQVSGANRYKYFRRPISAVGTKSVEPGPYIPFMQQVPPDVLLASARQDPLAGGNADQSGLVDRPPTPPNKTVETQTDYRDSEAQTDPYTPEYVVRPGSQPELLTLATLSYGRGLPAGLAEVEMIERARAKRAWEATLPPLNDTEQLDKRRRMMDEMERKEWSLRESEIEKLQEARLDVLKKLLRQREEHHQELNTKRLDRLWAKKQEEKEDKVKKIRNEHIKTIRKLTEKRRRVEGKLERRAIVKEYADSGSQVYAPMTRIGVFLDRASEQYVVKSRYLNTYQGLLELENSLPDFVTQPRIKAPKPKTATKSGFVKRRYRRERELAEIHEQIVEEKKHQLSKEERIRREVIKENKMKADEPPKPLRFLQKIEKPIPRPPTPSVEVPSEEEEERELAIIALQQVIRGRAIQNMMFEGKEKRIELIRELRSTHALQEAEQGMKKQERQATLALQRQRRLHEHKESFVDEALSNLEGTSLGDTMDFLSKELIRMQEERRIHAFSMLAERQRRIREAEESGRRQLEERRRREEDEVFKQMVQVHQDTVDTYLEDIILGAVDSTADEEARQEIQEQATKINDIAYELEENRDDLVSEEIVSELVHGFLMPEVQKIHIRQKVKLQQRKYLQAAHQDIFKDSEGVIDMFPKRGAESAPSGAPAQPAAPAVSPAPAAPAVSPPPAAPAVSPPPADKPSSRPASRPASETPGSRRGSAASQKSQKADVPSKPGTPDLSVAGTAAKPGSASGSKPPTPKGSKPTTPAGSRPASGRKSAAGSKPPSPVPQPSSRPGSSGSKRAGSRPTSQPGSRPTSQPGSTAGSRPGSATKLEVEQ